MNELSTTERRDPVSARPDEMSTESVLRLMNDEDRKMPEALAAAQLHSAAAAAADFLVEARPG